MGWLIAFGVLTAVALLPIGVRWIYRQNDPGVWIFIGPAAIRVYSGAGKQKDATKKAKPVSKNKSADTKNKIGGKYKDFEPLLQTLLGFFGEFSRKFRVSRLEFHLLLAGDDPCDLAVNYGRAWAAVGNILPQLERIYVIKKQEVDVACDFAGDATRVYMRVDITITVGRFVALLIRYGVPGLNQFKTIKNLRKGGAKV